MNEDLKNKFTAFIQSEALFTENEPVLLAVSGGQDSVVMTHLFAQCSYRFAVAHVNFGLRGQEADEDARWVAELARQHQVPFYTKKFATTDYAAEHGLSVQMAARQLRYDWFKAVRKREGYARTATAHHLGDQLETTLLNFCQGTGVAGLRGMRMRRGAVVRPLLFATRTEIEAYAQAQRIEWREDRSNASNQYQRNFLRHQVIPLLQTLNPSLLSTYRLTQERLLATEQLLANEVQRLEAQCRRDVRDEVWLDRQILVDHPQLPLVLSELLRPFGFSYMQARRVAHCLRQQAIPGKIFTSNKHTLLIDRQHLIISKTSEVSTEVGQIAATDTRVVLPPLTLSMKQHDAAGYQVRRRADVAALDADRLSFPLTVRPWRAGDWFCPLGMAHRKKLSDFLIDQKVPRHRKAAVRVVTSGEAIVWVVGGRIDHRFRVTPQTKKVYEISVATDESSPEAVIFDR